MGKDAAASLALAMKAKSPQENNKKQMALKLLEAKRQQAEAAKPAPIVAPTVINNYHRTDTTTNNYAMQEKAAKEHANKLQERADRLSEQAQKAEAQKKRSEENIRMRRAESARLAKVSAEMAADEKQTKADELTNKEKHAKIEKKKSSENVKRIKGFQQRLVDWGNKHLKSAAAAGAALNKIIEGGDKKSGKKKGGKEKDVRESGSEENTLDEAEELGSPATTHSEKSLWERLMRL